MDQAFALSRLDHRSYEQIRSEHEVVAVGERLRLVLEFVEKRAQHRLAELGGAPEEAIQVRQKPVAQPDPVADDRRDFRMQPRRIHRAACLP